ncbi:MAG TPA: flagellar biosynthetic protein FliR [Firmicutes bacterium]|nr:flagellar biosynthetic protein FliR [Bacillota bacterium]
MDSMMQSIDPLQICVAALIYARVSALLLTAPLFRSKNIPSMVKAGLALLIALLLRPSVNLPQALPGSSWELTGLLIREAVIGVSMGFLVQLFFLAVGVAGQLIDTEMGFHMVNVLDPLSDSQLPLVGNLFSTLCILLYLSLHGHLLLLRSVAESYRLLPLGGGALPQDTGLVINACVKLLALSVQLALPVIGASLFTSLVFGIMAKSVPQMNVFVVGMPLKIAILSVVIVVSLPGLVHFMEKTLGEVFLQLADWLASGGLP